ncbi:MAG: tripartite tricarboxylate transporter substrate binding protein, partial [Betaproteobacteria bacterium]
MKKTSSARLAVYAVLLGVAGSSVSAQVSPSASAQSASTGSGQAYPTRPIRVINTVAAGGPAELVARVIGQKLT